jgi:cytochrome oxidase Cu insertion factor (SCO1/SenC/PrrC family)
VRRPWRGPAALGLVGLLAAATARGEGPDLWQALELERPSVRVEAPRFTLPDLAGRPVGLEAFRGRVVLLYFWATW